VFNHGHAQDDLSLDENVYAIDVNGTGKRLLLGNAQEPAWSPDGSKIAFVRGLGDAIAVFDLKSKSSRRVIRSKSYAAAPAFSRDGTRLAFEDVPEDARVDIPYSICCSEIYVVNLDGTGLRRLTRNKEVDWGPTWTPDGRIVFHSDRGGPERLYVMNGDGSGVRRFVNQRGSEGR
jgi:TolB protein